MKPSIYTAKKRLDSFITKNWKLLFDKRFLDFQNGDIFSSEIKIARSFWQENIKNGNIKLGEKKIKNSFHIDELEKNNLYFNWKNILKSLNNNWIPKILPYPGQMFSILENQDFLIINKPAPLSVHPTYPLNKNSSREVTLVDQFAFYQLKENAGFNLFNPRTGIVHRLDKKTTGTMLLAKNDQSQKYLKSLFKKRLVKKHYLALVEGKPKEKFFKLEGWIGKKRENPLKMDFLTLKEKFPEEKIINPKTSITKFKLIFSGRVDEFPIVGPYSDFLLSWFNNFPQLFDNDKEYSLLKIKLLTGRTHQIRASLAHLGLPIVGDSLYGKKILSNDVCKVQALHSYKISFPDRDGKEIKVACCRPIFL